MDIPNIPELGQYEGDSCNAIDSLGISCPGTLEYGPVESCRCHLSAPCNACTDNPLVCTECSRKVTFDD